MNTQGIHGNLVDYVCPSCGFKTSAPKESASSIPKLGDIPSSTAGFQEVTATKERAAPPDTSTVTSTKRKKKAAPPPPPEPKPEPKPEPPRPHPLLPEIQSDLKELTGAVEKVEMVFDIELQKVKNRIKDLERKISEVQKT